MHGLEETCHVEFSVDNCRTELKTASEMGVDIETAQALLETIDQGLNGELTCDLKGIIPYFMLAFEDAVDQLKREEMNPLKNIHTVRARVAQKRVTR
jgi:hypothetical protein